MADRKTPFGRVLASLRAARGMSVNEAAALVDRSPATWGVLETGRRSIDSAIITEITDALRLTVDERLRLAYAWGQAGIEGAGVVYRIHSLTPSADRAAALLCTFYDRLSPTAWQTITAAVLADLGRSDLEETAA